MYQTYFECEILKGDTLRDILNIEYNIKSIDEEHENYIYSILIKGIKELNGKTDGFKVYEKIKLPLFVTTKYGCFPCKQIIRNIELNSDLIPHNRSESCNICMRYDQNINHIALGANNQCVALRICDHCLELLKLKLGGGKATRS